MRSENLGYLKVMNRRCVSQSRAKNGLYFIGNLNPFMGQTNVWTPIIKQLQDSGRIGSELQVQCPKHQKLSQTKIKNSKDLNILLDNREKFCQIKCDAMMPCKIREHNCELGMYVCFSQCTFTF